MLTPVATDIPTMPRAVTKCCWKNHERNIDDTPANGPENRLSFRSCAVLVIHREPVGHADP